MWLVVLALVGLPAMCQKLESGDLRQHLNSLPLPGSGSESFQIPAAENLAAFRGVMETALQGEFARAATQADRLGYDLVRYTDAPSSRIYTLLRERAGGGGQGTYVFRPEACRRLVFQAPHAGGDANTGRQSIDLFLRLDAAGLFLPGTHRCANRQASPCEGTTTVCAGSPQAYPVSDVAHFTRSYFQAAHEVAARAMDNAIFVQMHGFTWEPGDPDLMISNATCQRLPRSIATQLSGAFEEAFQSRGSGLSAGSCNAAGGPARLCAQTNVQARFLAGAADPCQCAGGGSTCASSSACPQTLPYPERFLHIEQSCATREFTTCSRPGRFSFEDTAQVFERFFPCTPALRAVTHGATFEQEALAPGTIYSVFGEHIPADVRVTACEQPAAVLHSGGGQVNGVLAESRLGGSCQVRLSLGQSHAVPFLSNSLTVATVEQALALFRHDGLAIITHADGTLVNEASPARPGEIVVLWGTGGGLTDAQMRLAKGPEITIDGAAVAIHYAGRAPGFLGLDQMNVVVPETAQAGRRALAIQGRRYEIWIGER
ncbi:MAG: hypothetical protein FJW20_04985 [Acidimicrobiia bacterium]|nr:hypothetical protein [Acidimicrobiia bacterium]